MFPLILDKFRDKKTIMIDETHSALAKFFYAISPEEIMQDIDKALCYFLIFINLIDKNKKMLD